MRIVKTLELNEDQMHLLILNGMGMTKQEICDATGRGEAEVTASITEALTGWKTEILAAEDDDAPEPSVAPPMYLPESRPLDELRAEWGSAVPVDAKPVDNGEFLKACYPSRRAFTKNAGGKAATEDQYNIWVMANKGMTMFEIASALGKSQDCIRSSISRMKLRGFSFSHTPQPSRSTKSRTKESYKTTKEGINISQFEHQFAQLYARGEHNLIQMADALGVKLQAIHDVRYRLKNKLAIRDDIEFNYALRAIAEL